ncbi:MAG: hypothetical protein K0S10_3190 [Rubrobacteraceae bacterium]|jgi:hypothetical protein|nr:hypothetical protein [Rubrobacteraceae bacterium]
MHHAHRPFEAWEGEAVEVTSEGNTPATRGILAEVNNSGIVMRFRQWVAVRSPVTEEAERQSPNELREISLFRPWHTISGVRLLEPEEEQALESMGPQTSSLPAAWSVSDEIPENPVP